MPGNEPEERPILYIGYWSRALRRRRFEGIRRYAKSRGWGVVPVLSSEVPDVPSLRAVLARHRPVGVVAECAGSPPAFPPRAFGRVPVVYFDPPERAAWRGAAFVACDEAAVVRAAFLELAAGRPPAYAMVSSLSARPPRWARERDAAFRSLCAAAGKQCLVFQPKIGETPEARARRLVSWVAALPQRCAVFAIDDYRAEEATRAFAAARRSLPRTATLVGANGVGATEGAGDFPVSTVEIDFELSGYLAARLLGTSGDGPSAAAAFAAAGKLGGAVDFSQGVANASGGSIQSWVSAEDKDKLDGFDDFTVELWTYDVEATAQQLYMGKRVDSSTGSWWLYKNSGAGKAMNLTVTADGTNGKSVATATPVPGAWNHVAFVRDTAEGKGYGYLAGAPTGTNSLNAAIKTGTLYSGAGAFYLGDNYATGSNRCQGKIDELRISRVARSADWIQASHDCVENAAFATYTTSAAQAANDWGRYARQFSVTFSGAPATALADFPVLVRLSEGVPVGFSYADCLRANGGDLRFADAGGNLLPSEVDTWNTNGESLVWVKVPSLAAGTRIKAYYGWGGAPAVDGSKVWDGDYVGVWHLGESALPLRESSGVSTPFGVSSNLAAAAFSAVGEIGGAVDFTKTEGGTRPWLSAEDDDDLDGFGSFTVEVWTKRSSTSGNKFVLSKREPGSSEVSYSVFQTGGGVGALGISTDGSTTANILAGGNSGMSLTWGQWSHQAYVRDVAAMKAFGYVNGNQTGEPALNSSDRIYAGSAKLYLGNQTSGRPEAFNGLADEVRISRVARSAAWVKAAHDTVADASFARYSAVRANNDTFFIVFR